MNRHLGLLLLLLLWSAPAFCDPVVVRTKTGQTYEGELVKETPGAVKIKTPFGTYNVLRANILTISKGVSPETEFKKKRKAVSDTDARGLLALATWCEKRELYRLAAGVYEEAGQIAGPDYIQTRLRQGALAMKTGDYRTAVLCYSDLAERLKNNDAQDALQEAEDRLRSGRIKFWKEAETAFEQKRWDRAIPLYIKALHRAVRDDPVFESDVGRTKISQQIFRSRVASLKRMEQRIARSDVLALDRPRMTWAYQVRPGNLRSRSVDISILEFRREMGQFAGNWLALRGVYHRKSRWNNAQAVCIELSKESHPELAVAAYKSNSSHRNAMEQLGKSIYLEELLKSYPYKSVADSMDGLVPMAEVVCFGRLRRRKNQVPPFVFEVWAVESNSDPEAIELAGMLKKSLRCRFDGSPMETVLNFINMVSGVEVTFESGEIPAIDVNLEVKGRPVGAVISRLAKNAGLTWTRKGTGVLMKQKLTQQEEALYKQVVRLAND